MSATVTIDRSEFDEIVVMLGAFSGFADRVFAGGGMDSMLWNRPLEVQRRLIIASGGDPDDEQQEEARYKLESEREQELLYEYVAGVVPSTEERFQEFLDILTARLDAAEDRLARKRGQVGSKPRGTLELIRGGRDAE